MPKSKNKNSSQELQPLLFINLPIFILLLSLFNLSTPKQKEIKVLGKETDNDFWIEFVAKHPTYRDGWVELGRLDKAIEIDPNFKP